MNDANPVALPLDNAVDPAQPVSVQVVENRILVLNKNIENLKQQRSAKQQEVQQKQQELQQLEFSVTANTYVKQHMEELKKELVALVVQ